VGHSGPGRSAGGANIAARIDRTTTAAASARAAAAALLDAAR